MMTNTNTIQSETREAEVVEWAKAQPVTVWVTYGVSIDLAWQVDLYLIRASREAR